MISRISNTVFAIVVAAVPAFATAADAHNGKQLADSNCQQCHGTEVYTRPDHKVKNMGGLHKQVQMCNQSLGLTWFDEQVDDVATYLNQEYYKFK